MKRQIKALLILGLTIFPFLIFGQNEKGIPMVKENDQIKAFVGENYKLVFLDKITEAEKQTVNFYISPIYDEMELKQLYVDLINDVKIYKVEIKNDFFCEFVIDKNVTPEYISEILKAHSTDFLYKKIKKVEKTVPSQISDFVFESYKDYDNGKRKAYFKIKGINYAKDAAYIQEKMLLISEVKKFVVYDSENGLNKCMIEASNSVNEEFIKDKINSILLNREEK